jgi:hypothetical protein
MIDAALTGSRNSWPVRVTICSGKNFRVESPPANALVTLKLARELGQVLERFGSEVSTGRGSKVGIFFKPGIFGHHKVGRAADIYAVGGLGLDEWKRRWDITLRRCAGITNANERRAMLDQERQRNLGWRLYKTLQTRGRWSQPYGFPIQLFGPWTRSDGPWKHISDFLLNAHRDHIHVAK